MNRKFSLVLTLWLVSLVAVGAFMYVYATGSMTSPTFEAGTQVETASYTIWQEGITYYAKNGSTGTVTSGTNASEIIQAALDALQGNVHGYLSGKVYVKHGQYKLYNYLLIRNPNIILEGEGRATEFYQMNSSLPYLIKVQSAKLAPEYTYTHGVQIKNILFWSATPTSTYAIYFNNAYNIIWFPVIEDCHFINLNGIRTDPDATGINDVLQFPRFYRLFMVDPPQCGINLTCFIDARINDVIIFSDTQKQTTTGLYLNATITSGTIIEKVSVVRQGYGIHIVQSDDTQIINSFFDLCNNTYAMKIEDSSRIEVAHTYNHAPYGTGFLILGSSNLTRLVSCTAKLCSVGVNDTTTDCIQYLIGFISTVDCTTQYVLGAEDVIRGCLDIADQG